MQYPGIDHELAMAWEDAFSLEEVAALSLPTLRSVAGSKEACSNAKPRLAKLTVEHANAGRGGRSCIVKFLLKVFVNST
jgi:serine/threonine-protein kinase HipA